MNPSSIVTTTEAVDKAFYVIFGICALSLVGITVAGLSTLYVNSVARSS